MIKQLTVLPVVFDVMRKVVRSCISLKNTEAVVCQSENEDRG
jgi:hypothetical protein